MTGKEIRHVEHHGGTVVIIRFDFKSFQYRIGKTPLQRDLHPLFPLIIGCLGINPPQVDRAVCSRKFHVQRVFRLVTDFTKQVVAGTG